MDNLLNDLELKELAELEREFAARVRGVEFGSRAPDAEKAWAAIVDNAQSVENRKHKSGYSERGLRRWVGYSITACCILSAGMLLTLAAPSVWKQVTSRGEVITRDYITRRAERTKVQLPDGSQVVMAPDTRISYKSSANGDRTVSLQGQAYFTVTHDTERPFTVQTGAISTRVLGTSFAVRAYSTDHTAQVAVAEGKVSTGTQKASTIILLAGDVARVSPNQGPIVTHDSKTTDVFGWMHGQLAFGGVPFRDVAIELERFYDIKIQFSDSILASRGIVAVFAGESISKVLESLSTVVDASYTRKGNVVLFTARQ